MSDKPSYLGLLNALAVNESRAHCYFTAWIATSPSEDVRAVLSTVAAREGEHGMTFAKRINELGYAVREKPDPEHDKRMKIAQSKKSDLQKMEALVAPELAPTDGPDIFDRFFADHTIDIRTGELLGRYIAEERDSERLLRSCYEQLAAAARGGASSSTPEALDRLTALDTKVDALCAAVEELRQVVCAPAMTNGTS
jgi:rubrerythrin